MGLMQLLARPNHWANGMAKGKMLSSHGSCCLLPNFIRMKMAYWFEPKRNQNKKLTHFLIQSIGWIVFIPMAATRGRIKPLRSPTFSPLWPFTKDKTWNHFILNWIRCQNYNYLWSLFHLFQLLVFVLSGNWSIRDCDPNHKVTNKNEDQREEVTEDDIRHDEVKGLVKLSGWPLLSTDEETSIVIG